MRCDSGARDISYQVQTPEWLQTAPMLVEEGQSRGEEGKKLILSQESSSAQLTVKSEPAGTAIAKTIFQALVSPQPCRHASEGLSSRGSAGASAGKVTRSKQTLACSSLPWRHLY